VYGEILAGERFETVVNTAHQKPFVAYCIRRRQIDPLLVFSIKHGLYVGSYKTSLILTRPENLVTIYNVLQISQLLIQMENYVGILIRLFVLLLVA